MWRISGVHQDSKRKQEARVLRLLHKGYMNVYMYIYIYMCACVFVYVYVDVHIYECVYV